MLRPLALLTVVFLIFAACSGGEDAPVVVQFVLPTATVDTPPGEPSPTPVPVDVILSAESVNQGGAILVSVTGPVESGSLTFLGRNFPLTQGDRSIYAFIPVDVDDSLGVHRLHVELALPNGSTGNWETTIEVLATEWAVDEVTFDAEQQELLTPEIVAEENALLSTAYATFTPEKLWNGLFQFPVLGGLTAPFGEQRAVNGAPPSGHHTGSDFGTAEGAEVITTSSGRVVMVETLEIRGNMVIVDHGGGLLSGYAHLSEVVVVAGQMIEAGEVIGKVGSTGLSTGAHLHWEMSVGGVRVDPSRFVDGTNGF
ncbi:MAG TPA: M23 family metallopeptidase [Dehalococcoidia bacterium]|nr:M23 family metallopeptidase [Dehalococcoidia bacterium]